MEFADLGKHCEEPSCRQLDFLPFVCSACKRTFCSDHRTFQAHNCPEVKNVIIPECPICGQFISVERGDDPNVKIDQHIEKGCPTEAIARSQNKCSYRRCKNTELVPFLCNLCNRNFCVTHRLSQDHQCTKLEKKEPKESLWASLGQQVKERIDNLILQQTAKKPTAKKVQMMKLKTKAIGNANIPPEKRFYAEVIFPLESRVQPKLMFFNSNWTIGKVLDVAADAGGIENNNNQANAEKLRIISLKNGLPLENSIQLKDCQEVLQSGDSILLERVKGSD